MISRALSGTAKPIPHRVLEDETAALLGGRFVAFLLEPKRAAVRPHSLSTALELLAAIHNAKGTTTGQKASERWLVWAEAAAEGDLAPSWLWRLEGHSSVVTRVQEPF